MKIPSNYKEVTSGICQEGDIVKCIEGEFKGYTDFALALIRKPIPIKIFNESWQVYRKHETADKELKKNRKLAFIHSTFA